MANEDLRPTRARANMQKLRSKASDVCLPLVSTLMALS